MDTSTPTAARTVAPDKLQPHNIEAEEAVLGALLIDPDAIIRIATFLEARDFFLQRHRWIYEAIQSLHERREPTDLVTLTDELARRNQLEGVGGPAFLTDLINATPTSIHVEYYARIVERTAVLRRLIEGATQIAQLAYEDVEDVEEIIDRAESIIFGVSEQRTNRDLKPIRHAIDRYYDRIEYLSQHQGEIVGIPTGLKDLDKLLGGMQRADLLILAGRPGMGKTSLALSIALQAARKWNKRIAIFSLEMSDEQLVQRLLSAETGIDSQRLRLGQIHDDEWPLIIQATTLLSECSIFLDDTPAISVMELRTKARRLEAEFGLDLIVVDYLQLMRGNVRAENRQQEISYISRSLKELARELKVPVLALSQLSRAVESRHDKRPMLSDLRESGCLTGDTLIYLPDDGRYVPIRELAGQSSFRVMGLNTETWKLEAAVVSRAFCTGIKPVYRLTTRLGRTIRATANHKFLTFGQWKRLDELRVNDRIALPRTLAGPATPSMSHAELALLAHLIGDGCTLPRHAIQYTTKEKDLADTVIALTTEVFGDTIQPRLRKERSWYQLYLSARQHLTHHTRNPIAQWLDRLEIFGLRSCQKYVPACVFQQPPEGIALFLRHLWATDGCIHYLEAIEQYLASRQANTNRDTIPRDIWREHVVSAMQQHNITTRQLHARLGNAYCGTALYKQNISRERAARVAQAVQSEAIGRLATSDVYWDEIVSIEASGEAEVYDLTVPTCHNFVANNIIAHNSIEQDADVVMFVYRDEIYNPDTEFPNIAEIIVAKHRSGPTGNFSVYFKKQLAQFVDLEVHTQPLEY